MRKFLLLGLTLAGLAGAGFSAPANAQQPVWTGPAGWQRVDEDGWREREWRRHERWEEWRRHQEWRRWHEYHGY